MAGSTSDDYSDYGEEEEVQLEAETEDKTFFKYLNKVINLATSNEIIQATFIVDKTEALLAIMKFSYKHSLGSTATADLCKMINSFVNVPFLPDSRYLVDNYFYPGDGMVYHAVCPNCKMYIGKFERKSRTLTCKLCEHVTYVNSPAYRDFFVTLDISQQLQHLLVNNAEYYHEVISRRYEANDTFRDIHNGMLYRHFVASLPEDDRRKYVSLTFNSDGSPVFKSSKFSVWPIQVYPNEIPVHLRYSSPLTYALWFGHDKPDMSIFLDPFVTEMKNLSEHGITYNSNAEKRKIKPYAICCCVDSVARSPMQGMMQYNASYGCAWCLHPGELVLHKTRRTRKYTLLDEIPADRTEAETVGHISRAVATDAPVFGMKNASPLLNLKHFEIIRGFVPDAMHSISLGVAKQFAEYWFGTSKKPYSILKVEITRLDNLIQSLKVPDQIARLSRSITDRRFWKAREWENWILYYSLPILHEIPRLGEYTKHWSLLVEGFYILLKQAITREDLEKADVLLRTFIAHTELNYSKDAMTYNVHQLQHMAHSVANWGPLWAHTAYSFESGNGRIVKSVHAAKGVINQICRNISMKHALIMLEEHVSKKENSNITPFIAYLDNRFTRNSYICGSNLYCGKEVPPMVNLIASNTPQRLMRAYTKLVKNRCAFKSYDSVCARSDNSFEMTDDGTFIQIKQFIVDRSTRQEYTICRKVAIKCNYSETCSTIKVVDCVSSQLISINTTSIEKICIYMSIDGTNYISPLPNMYCYS